MCREAVVGRRGKEEGNPLGFVEKSGWYDKKEVYIVKMLLSRGEVIERVEYKRGRMDGLCRIG